MPVYLYHWQRCRKLGLENRRLVVGPGGRSRRAGEPPRPGSRLPPSVLLSPRNPSVRSPPAASEDAPEGEASSSAKSWRHFSALVFLLRWSGLSVTSPAWSMNFCFSRNTPSLASRAPPWARREGSPPATRGTPAAPRVGAAPRRRSRSRSEPLSGRDRGEGSGGCRRARAARPGGARFRGSPWGGWAPSAIAEQPAAFLPRLPWQQSPSLLSEWLSHILDLAHALVSRALVFLFQTFVLARHSTFTFLMRLFLCCFF